MEAFDIEPRKEIGIIKSNIKEAILEGKIPNNREKALELMYIEAEKLGLKPKK